VLLLLLAVAIPIGTMDLTYILVTGDDGGSDGDDEGENDEDDGEDLERRGGGRGIFIAGGSEIRFH
jgi:hypothetical protein